MNDLIQQLEDFLNSDEFAKDEAIGLDILGQLVTQADIDQVAADQYQEKHATYAAIDAAAVVAAGGTPTHGKTGFDAFKGNVGPEDGTKHLLGTLVPGDILEDVLIFEAFRRKFWDMAFIACSKIMPVPAVCMVDAPAGFVPSPPVTAAPTAPAASGAPAGASPTS